jgi:hypothetical protein
MAARKLGRQNLFFQLLSISYVNYSLNALNISIG